MKLIARNRRTLGAVALILSMCMLTACGGLVEWAASYAADTAPSVDSMAELRMALGRPDVTDVSLSEEFYSEVNTWPTYIEIVGAHTRHVTITGIDDKKITAAGLHIRSGSLTLRDVNIEIASMTDDNVKLAQWTPSPSYYGAGVLIDEVMNVALDSCEIDVTNEDGPAFTAGVLSLATAGLTVKDCKISARGKGANAVHGLMIYRLGSDTAVTGNTLSGVQAAPAANPHHKPASALYIHSVRGAAPANLDFSGNSFQSGATTDTAPYSFYINRHIVGGGTGSDMETGAIADPEMEEGGFASYDASGGVSPWIMGEGATGGLHKLVASLAAQSGDGYGVMRVLRYAAGEPVDEVAGRPADELTEGYETVAGEVTAIDFIKDYGGNQVTDDHQHDSIEARGRVDALGAKTGAFRLSRHIESTNINFDEDRIDTKDIQGEVHDGRDE